MTYPFVAAKYFTRGGMKELRAVVVHMAEGGGTVSWLTHPTNDNSSHFVIEYSGRIVQMVADGDADHSLHVDESGGAGNCGGTFSYAAAKSVLGADGYADPNAYLFAVEMEGFAASGPNAAQMTSLKALIDDLRKRHPTLRGLLGHRDFQGYKACPGCHVFDKLPHGAFAVVTADASTGDPMLAFRFLAPAVGSVTVNGTGHALIRLSDGRRYAVAAGEKRESFAKVSLLQPLDTAPGDRSTCYLIGAVDTTATTDPNVEAAVLLATDVTYAAGSAVDCTAVVAAARQEAAKAATTAQFDKDRLTAKAAQDVLTAGGLLP